MLGGAGARRTGRLRATTVLAVVPTLTMAFAACTGPTPKISQCRPSLIKSVETITTKLTTKGTLRHARTLETGDGGHFVSAELLPAGEPQTFDGKIVTWFTRDPNGEQFLAVDANAREMSAWPDAPFDVRREGAVTSRGCVLPVRGTPADSECQAGLEQFC